MIVKYVNLNSTRSFGVELEMNSTPLSKEDIGKVVKKCDKKHACAVTNWGLSDGSQWHVKNDSSCGWEVASYKGYGIADLLTIAKVTEGLQKAGCQVTSQCGLHVHVDVEDYKTTHLASLLAHWLKIEPVICAILPAHRVKNKYCKLLTEYYSWRTKRPKWTPRDFWSYAAPRSFDDNERRVMVNVCNVATYHRHTIEFRFPEGTLDPEDVKNWVRLFVRFVGFCRRKPFPTNFTKVDLAGAMQILGLNGNKEFFILSKGLRDTKEWFLRWVVKYSTSASLCKEAVDMLNKMWAPVRTYELSSNCETFVEAA